MPAPDPLVVPLVPRRRLSPLGWIAIGAAVVVVAIALAGTAGARPTRLTKASSSSSSRTVTVTATGSATGVPDQMTVDVTVTTGGASAADVLADNNARTHKIFDQLKMTAVEEKDVQTTAVDLGPTYDKHGNITGYVAHNSLIITFRSLKSAGTKLDYLVAGGDNHVRVGSFQLGFQDDDKILSEARRDAVKRAKTQATEMAEAAGSTLGEAKTIAEITPQQYQSYGYAADSQTAARAVSPVPVAAGSQEKTINVKVVWQLT